MKLETIKNYLDSVFHSLPKTEELMKQRTEIESNMLRRYTELKNEGKSENEAVGAVICEAGSINELLEEMSSAPAAADMAEGEVDLDTALHFIDLKAHTSHIIATGVFLILFGVATLITLSGLIDCHLLFAHTPERFSGIFPVVFLLIFVAVAVGLFISCSNKLDAYRYIEEGRFNLSSGASSKLSSAYLQFKQPGPVIIGVMLCILSPALIIIGSIFGELVTILCVAIFLLIIAAAVALFITYCIKNEAYKQLLKLKEYSAENRSHNKVISTVASIVWPLAACFYLIYSFISDRWDISWIIFPVVGILFGAFSTIYSNLHSQK